MSTSSNTLIDDIFYIPTVPRYKEDLVGEMDDTIGDIFFELLDINVENVAPRSKFVEAPKSVRSSKRLSVDKKPPAKDESVPKVKAQPRPVRRSLMNQQIPTVHGLENNDKNRDELLKRSTRSKESIASDTKLKSQNISTKRSQPLAPKQPPPTPKRVASSIFSNPKPALVQPPMRFGNTTQRRSILPQTQPSTPKRTSSVYINPKPTIVQPPMCFGNATKRRSFMPDNESPIRSNASVVSRAVRGIPISRRTQLFEVKK